MRRDRSSIELLEFSGGLNTFLTGAVLSTFTCSLDLARALHDNTKVYGRRSP